MNHISITYLKEYWQDKSCIVWKERILACEKYFLNNLQWFEVMYHDKSVLKIGNSLDG